MKIHATREDWLTAAIAELRPIFELHGKPLANNIRVSCGYPLNYKRNKRLGDCHASTESADKSMEIFIAPVISDESEVFAALLTQLCRTTAGALNYGAAFESIATAVRLDVVRPNGAQIERAHDFAHWYCEMIESLGEYPHAEMSVADIKTQNTRMLKAFCPACGYTVRLSTKWALIGLPICPVDESPFTLAPTV